MWLWLAAGWSVAAVVLALLHRRIRRVRPALPPEIERFLQRLEAELAAFPQVQYLGLLPGQFACLLRVGGQDTPVSLHELHRRADAFGDAFPQIVAELVREIEEVGLDRVGDHDFGAVATSILPQVRSMRWVEQQGRFGDAAIVHRRLGEDLAVVYVIDDPQTMTFVCRAHLRQWFRDDDDVHQLALANLGRLGGADRVRAAPAGGPTLLQTGDGYDAARVLLLEATEGLLVAVPDRDTLWLGHESGDPGQPGIAALMAAAGAMARSAAHPVSDRIYRVRAGYLEAVPDGDGA